MEQWGTEYCPITIPDTARGAAVSLKKPQRIMTVLGPHALIITAQILS